MGMTRSCVRLTASSMKPTSKPGLATLSRHGLSINDHLKWQCFLPALAMVVVTICRLLLYLLRQLRKKFHLIHRVFSRKAAF